MICQIRGKVIRKKDNSLVIDVNGICYEVFVPNIILRGIESAIDPNGEISLFTYHYFQSDPSKSFPMLIGFINEIEKDFFESFISVSGVGPKAAVKALNMPISLISQAIDEGNVAFLKSLPGIGQQRAKEIIAKLQGKVGKFGLVQDKDKNKIPEAIRDFENEALEVLKQLQYKPSEAKAMIVKALERSPEIKTVEELLNEVYRQRTLK